MVLDLFQSVLSSEKATNKRGRNNVRTAEKMDAESVSCLMHRSSYYILCLHFDSLQWILLFATDTISTIG